MLVTLLLTDQAAPRIAWHENEPKFGVIDPDQAIRAAAIRRFGQAHVRQLVGPDGTSESLAIQPADASLEESFYDYAHHEMVRAVVDMVDYLAACVREADGSPVRLVTLDATDMDGPIEPEDTVDLADLDLSGEFWFEPGDVWRVIDSTPER